MRQYTEVLFDEMKGEGGNLGLITLNRPEVLNSLNQPMIQAMHDQLKIWAAADYIKAVVIRPADGRAFCAGGDLRSTYARRLEKDAALPRFFYDEYQLNRTIHHYPKPYIAFLDGITMGGGVGISIHGSHRVATDRLLFAMPETGIGFFPDVGGTYFLPRLKGQMGFYLGLTGARINADDCVAFGLTQQKAARETLPEILHALASRPFTEENSRAIVSAILDEFKVPIRPSTLFEQHAVIDRVFAGTTMEEVMDALQYSTEEICEEALTILAKKSPTSLKVTLRALHEGRELDFDACMQQEFRLASRFLEGHDFFEGIRAIIIDKDQRPRWQPGTLAQVADHQIEHYFSPLIHELV